MVCGALVGSLTAAFARRPGSQLQQRLFHVLSLASRF